MSDIALSNGKVLSLDKLGVKKTKSLAEILDGDIVAQEHFDKVLVVLLDLSGSMLDRIDFSTGGFSPRKVDAMWKAFKIDLAPKLAGWPYGVLAFQDISAHWIIYPIQDPKALTVTKQPEANGSTPMKRALETAWGWVRINADQARFILITDGCPTDCTEEDLIEIVKRHSKIPIDTIGIGSLSHDQSLWSYGSFNEKLLQTISEITGGVYSRVSDVSSIIDTIVKLSPTNRPLLGPAK